MPTNGATISSLSLEITTNASGASAGLDALTRSLEKIKLATRGGLSLTAVANEIRTANTTINSSLSGFQNAVTTLTRLGGIRIPPSLGTTLTALATAISGATSAMGTSVVGLERAVRALTALGRVVIPTTIGTNITAIATALSSVNFTALAAQVSAFVAALAPLRTIGRINFSSLVTSLAGLPAAISAINIPALTAQVRALAAALSPLASVMTRIAAGAAALPAGLLRLVAAMGTLTTATNRASNAFITLYAKISMVIRIARAFAKLISLSSEATETMNLFKISMGEYAKEAYDYAQAVEHALGIDPIQWAGHQSIFMTLADGFGVARDRAALMSQQLTQLGYDLSSFVDISVDDAMQKLQSGLAGELEPLRRIGYDLSQAKLEAVALSLGIDKAVSSMTQAEKAELRYYAIMTQVTSSHGDMARTLDSPANQLRILKSQLTQLGRTIGNFFIPILNKVLPYAIGAAKVLRELLNVFGGLLGIQLADVDWGDDSLTSATEDIVSNLEDGQEEAKKLKSQMLGFDELNVFSTETDEDILGTGFDFELPTYDFLESAITTRIDEIVEKMREWVGLTDGITSWADFLDTKLGNIATWVTAIAAGIATWAITKRLITFVTSATTLFKTILKTKSLTIALGISLIVTGLVLAADVIRDAVTEGLESVDIGEMIGSAGLIIAGGALIGKAFGAALTGAAIAAIVVGVAGLGLALYDAIVNELNVTNTLTLAFSAALIGAGVGYLVNGALGAAMGALMGVVIAGAAAGAIWIIQNVEDTVAKVFGIVSAAELALGAILAFSGINVPLGIALMATGAVSLASQIALNTNALSNEIKGIIAVITTAVSAAVLAVGAILAFTGANIPLGIGMMVSGVIMGASVIPNWNALNDGIQIAISAIMATVGLAGLAIGAVMAFSGANIPLGIGLMLMGAASLGTAIALNWDSIVTAIQGTVGKIMAIVGAAAMVIGLILLFTGVGVPLGLGLLLGGAASLGTAVAFNWNSIVESIKGAWQQIKNYWNTNIAHVFTKEYWTNLAAYIGMGMLAGLTNKWEDIKAWFKGLITKVKDIFGIHSPSTVFAEIGEYLIEGLLNGLKSVFNGVITWFNYNLITPISNAFAGIWSSLRTGASSAWEGVKSVFSSVATFFKDTFKNAWNGIVSIFSYAGNIFVNIRDGIVSVFKTVVNGLITGINNVIAVPFNAINTALTTIKNIRIMDMYPFGGIKTITVPRIPTLADGGMLTNSGQLFIAREAGPELVANIGGKTAVMNNDQIVESVSAGVYQAVLAALGGNSDDGGDTNIVITLDGEKIYENQQKIARGRGYNLGMGAFAFG